MNLEAFKHIYTVKLRFSDFDIMGHVNNARFLTYVEDARIKYLEDAITRPLHQLDYASIVAHLDIDYKAPVLPYDEVQIFTRTIKTGDKSLTLESQVIRYPRGVNEEAMTAAICNTVLVTINIKSGKPIKHPQEMLEGIKQLEK